MKAIQFEKKGKQNGEKRVFCLVVFCLQYIFSLGESHVKQFTALWKNMNSSA